MAPRCPHCGQRVDVCPDPGGGEYQDYIEDCAVCCHPLRFRVRQDERGDVLEARVDAAQ